MYAEGLAIPVFLVVAGWCLVTLALLSLDKDLTALELEVAKLCKTGEDTDGT